MYSVRIKTQIWNGTIEVKTWPSFGFKHTFAATIETFYSKWLIFAIFRYFLAIFFGPWSCQGPKFKKKTN
jgi:hypothetical protein